MGKFDHRSRDQKRKAKLKKRLARSTQHESLAYHGGKYKTAQYVGILHRTEVGIHETNVITRRTLTDDQVEHAIETLILQMREGPLPPMPEEISGTEEELIILNIRRNWMGHAETHPLPGREDLIGVLRTILSSLETWRAKSMESRGYLHFLEGFMKQTGVSVQLMGPDDEVIDDDEDDELLEIGRDWVETGDEEAEAEFAEEVEAALAAGETERVLEICQQLIGETGDRDVIAQLQTFALRGHRALPGGGDSPPGPPAKRRRFPFF
jgi:hypothetical protein